MFLTFNYATTLRRIILDIRSIDILSHPDFKKSQSLFLNYLKYLKAKGKGIVEHHREISENDLKLIVQNLSLNDNVDLQLLTWFYITFFLQERV